MRKIFLLLLVGLLGTSCVKLSDFEEFQEDQALLIDDLQYQIDSLVTQLGEETAQLQDSIDDNASDIAANFEAINAANAAIAENLTAIGQVSTTLTQEISDLYTALETTESELVTLINARTVELLEALAAGDLIVSQQLAWEVAALRAEIDAAQAAAEAYADANDEVGSFDASGLQTQINNTSNRVELAEIAIGQVSSTVASNTIDIENLELSLENLRTNVRALDPDAVSQQQLAEQIEILTGQLEAYADGLLTNVVDTNTQLSDEEVIAIMSEIIADLQAKIDAIPEDDDNHLALQSALDAVAATIITPLPVETLAEFAAFSASEGDKFLFYSEGKGYFILTYSGTRSEGGVTRQIWESNRALNNNGDLFFYVTGGAGSFQTFVGYYLTRDGARSGGDVSYVTNNTRPLDVVFANAPAGTVGPAGPQGPIGLTGTSTTTVVLDPRDIVISTTVTYTTGGVAEPLQSGSISTTVEVGPVTQEFVTQTQIFRDTQYTPPTLLWTVTTYSIQVNGLADLDPPVLPENEEDSVEIAEAIRTINDRVVEMEIPNDAYIGELNASVVGADRTYNIGEEYTINVSSGGVGLVQTHWYQGSNRQDTKSMYIRTSNTAGETNLRVEIEDVHGRTQVIHFTITVVDPNAFDAGPHTVTASQRIFPGFRHIPVDEDLSSVEGATRVTVTINGQDYNYGLNAGRTINPQWTGSETNIHLDRTFDLDVPNGTVFTVEFTQ